MILDRKRTPPADVKLEAPPSSSARPWPFPHLRAPEFAPARSSQWVATALVLFAAFAGWSAWPVVTEASLAASGAAYLAFLFATARQQAGGSLGMASTIVLGLAAMAIGRRLDAIFVVFALAAVVRFPKDRRVLSVALSLAATALLLRLEASGALWWTSGAQYAASRWATKLAGKPVVLAISHYPFATLSFVMVSSAISLVAAFSWRRLAIVVAAFSLAVAGVATVVPVFALLAALVVSFAVPPRAPISSAAPRPSRLRAAILGSAMLLGGVVFSLAYAPGLFDPAPRPRVVTVVDGGLKTLKIPGAEDYPVVDDARFGGLVRFLGTQGWATHVVAEASDLRQTPAGTTLVFINPTRRLSPAQKGFVAEFVRRGGALLVLSDHTDIGGVRAPTNDALDASHIRIDFDSAIPLDRDSKWRNAIRTSPSPVFAHGTNDWFSISVGASLTIGPTVTPLIAGEFGFSDPGNPNYGMSRLGNMAPDPDEAQGGLILAAEESVGQGLVMAFGDTSGFQDGSVTYTHPFLVRLFERLRRHGPAPVVPGFAALAIVAGSLVLLGWARDARIAVVGAAAFIAASGAATWALQKGTWAQADSPTMVDASHFPKYPDHSANTSIFRLNETYLRTGGIALAASDFERIYRPEVRQVALVAPLQRYSEQEADRMVRWIEAGGRLLLIAGPESKPALAPFLKRIGVDLAAELTGAAQTAKILSPAVAKALAGKGEALEQDAPALRFRESYALVAPGAETLVAAWGKPIVVRKPIGAGRLTFIGDPRFANVENLGKETPYERNVRFLLQLL